MSALTAEQRERLRMRTPRELPDSAKVVCSCGQVRGLLDALAAAERERDEARDELRAWMRPGCKCAASLASDPPTDCDYPYCGCDPQADRVIAVLGECGALMPREAAALRAQVATLREALDDVWAAIGDALCSGRGIEKEYAWDVQRKVKSALASTATAPEREGADEHAR